MYQIATQDQYSFLYVNLLAADISQMFFKRFEARLIPKTKQEWLKNRHFSTKIGVYKKW